MSEHSRKVTATLVKNTIAQLLNLDQEIKASDKIKDLGAGIAEIQELLRNLERLFGIKLIYSDYQKDNTETVQGLINLVEKKLESFDLSNQDDYNPHKSGLKHGIDPTDVE